VIFMQPVTVTRFLTYYSSFLFLLFFEIAYSFMQTRVNGMLSSSLHTGHETP